MKKIVERKIRYDSSVVEYDCFVLDGEEQKITLFHQIVDSFEMRGDSYALMIPKGSYTIAYYWKERPYNVYMWRDKDGAYLGCYFNIVQNTYITDGLVSFEDLIIDLLVLPTGECFVLDEEELPVPLQEFEGGLVERALHSLIEELGTVLSEIFSDSRQNYSHEVLLTLLN